MQLNLVVIVVVDTGATTCALGPLPVSFGTIIQSSSKGRSWLGWLC
jgi:hypothetical protein